MSVQEQQRGWWLWSVNPLSLLLWPLSMVFCLLVIVRRRLYQWQWLKSCQLDKPVIVVGNISVGGTGKTPVVQTLVSLLQDKGMKPAILTRGYKSDFETETVLLAESATSERAGDEANMLSEISRCPIAVGADRIKSAEELLLNFPEVDILIADDGLQHYAMRRDMEIIVFRTRANGNGFCLPAGPLREPMSRLAQANLVIDRDSEEVSEQLGRCWNLQNPELTRQLDSFQGQEVGALAGIGFPQLFFNALQQHDLQIKSHAFPDHYQFSQQDLLPFKQRPLLVTHKDAVKLRQYGAENIWVVPLELKLSDDLQCRFFNILEPKLHG